MTDMGTVTSPAAGLLLVSLALGAAAFAAMPAPAMAEQFVLFDAKFTFTKADADNGVPNKSHYYVTSTNPDANFNAARPTNWISPVDYRNGIVHIRTEVIEKPAGGEATQWWLCYIAKQGVPGTDGYGCVGTGIYRDQGVYDREEAMTSWWNNTAIDWMQGIKQVDMVMKDGTGTGGNYTHLRPDPEHFFPTRMRVTVIQVSKGSTYDPTAVPGLPSAPADGGARDGADAATMADAPSESTIESGATPAGGSGTGGATGAGGAAGSAGFPGAAGAGGVVAAAGTGGAAGTNPGASGGAGETPIAPTPTDGTAGCSIATDHGTRGRTGGVASVAALVFAVAKRRARRNEARRI